jgi:hypothetical protein
MYVLDYDLQGLTMDVCLRSVSKTTKKFGLNYWLAVLALLSMISRGGRESFVGVFDNWCLGEGVVLQHNNL